MRTDLNPTPDTRLRRVRQGTSLIVHDGVYADPHAVRERALRADYGPREQGSYAGRNACKREIDSNVSALFAQLTGAPIHVRDHDAFGVFRLSFRGDPCVNFIHADPVTWGGVLYLNPPESSRGGTAFWRHRATGLTEHPFASWRQYGFRSPGDAWRRLVEEDGIHPERWERTRAVPARFNRVILFNSRLFHSHMPRDNFGETPETARLVQVFFFEPRPSPARGA